MLILPKSKWIFFLWIERLVHIVQGNFWINPCDSVVDHWSKGWPYTPYILMRQSSGQNMHGHCLRDPSRLCHVYASGERGGSVVECRTPEREVGGSKPTAAVLCPWARHFTPRKYWLITQEAVAPSRHDWKIVDWDVKPQHKQTSAPWKKARTS